MILQDLLLFFDILSCVVYQLYGEIRKLLKLYLLDGEIRKLLKLYLLAF